MRSRIAALAASLFGTIVVLLALAVVPAQSAPPATRGNLATQDAPLTRPTVITGKPLAGKPDTGGHHRIPAKAGGVTTQVAPTGYNYAAGQQVPAATQTYFQSNMWISKPTCSVGGTHSLAELTVQDGTNPSYDDNIIEVGWACEPTVFGDSNIHLFAGCWILGVFQGWNGGCGYLDNGSNATNLGAVLTADLNSVKKVAIQYTTGCAAGGISGWFVYYNAVAVGCFPVNGVANRLTNTSGELFQAFGEVFKSGTNCLGMGNDLFPTTTTTATAYFNTLSYQPTGAANAAMNLTATTPTVWGVLALNSPTTVFRYGGREAPAC